MAQNVQFRVGAPTRPDIKHDNGFLDKSPRRSPTADDLMKYKLWKAKLTGGQFADSTVGKIAIVVAMGPVAAVRLVIRSLPDALAAYQHFLDASGTDRHFDYVPFLENDPSGRLALVHSRVVTRQGAEQLYRDRYESRIKSGGALSFSMTGSAILVGGDDRRFPYPETENWQKAIGGHNIWISANVTVVVANGRPPSFQMHMFIHAEDRYNFNPGSEDIATGIPDSENGLFEITGLAKQYTQYAEASRVEAWTGKTVDFMQVMHNVPGTW